MSKGVLIFLGIVIVALGFVWFMGRNPVDTDVPSTDDVMEEHGDSMSPGGPTDIQDQDAMDNVPPSGSTGMNGSVEVETAIGTGETKTFTVTGKSFEFSVKEIRVKKGDRVRINFSSTEGFHDWVVDEFDAASERVQTGGSTSVEFVADTAGSFEYYCSVGNHRAMGMTGTLIVEG